MSATKPTIPTRIAMHIALNAQCLTLRIIDASLLWVRDKEDRHSNDNTQHHDDEKA